MKTRTQEELECRPLSARQGHFGSIMAEAGALGLPVEAVRLAKASGFRANGTLRERELVFWIR